MWLIPNEDEYWERVRESLEAPRKSEEPYLEEIVLEKEGIVPESARYDPQFDCIVFKYYEEAC